MNKLYYLPIFVSKSSKAIGDVQRGLCSCKDMGEIDCRCFGQHQRPVNTHHALPCLAIHLSQTTDGCFIRVHLTPRRHSKSKDTFDLLNPTNVAYHMAHRLSRVPFFTCYRCQCRWFEGFRYPSIVHKPATS
jgi:hypothetical protein